ncbi:MAG TPA: NAD(P)/FAD-dependent oxidoreductase [Acidimicrobiales bacterium]|nr:NAD(P)/FAD-dependent oxidoreductase [Acidimicrobiales bacterium]
MTAAAGRVHASLGRVGLPAPVAELAARRWDAVVVGGGHNGLTAAAYLARAGRSVLVLERRDRLGGACTLEQPFADERYVVSPCAYLVGLLHPLVIAELDLPRHGYRVEVADPAAWCPFEDGTAFTEWKDDRRTAAEVERLSPGDVEGFFAYQDVYRRIRDRLRSPGRDTWLGDSPDRDEIAELVGHDPEALEVLFELSVAELVERHVGDERLRTALHGAGVIGTWAGPRDPGTAAVRLMHNMGLTGGWGYVEGGAGRTSFAIAEAALAAGAVLATGVAVAGIEPGTGVVLEGGEVIRARAVLSNADPKRTLALCRGEVPGGFRARVDGWSTESPVVKVNCALRRLPTFTAAGAGATEPYRAMLTISTGIDATQAGFEACRRGEVDPAWCELYFQTAYDAGVAPPGRHTMSVFAQYAPYTLAAGDWDGRRDEVGRRVLASIARFAPDVDACVEEMQVLGPPDIEARMGLTGGHIFQGSCLPDQMWDRRFPPRTPVPGLYLCGAATHPGGSVIGVNGRNAATAVLADLDHPGRHGP